MKDLEKKKKRKNINGSVITHILKSDPYTSKWFQGYSTPDLPLPAIVRHKPALIVLNTDKSTGPGEHWCVVIINKNECEFFDSYGQSPEYYDFDVRFYDLCNTIYYNEFQIQGDLPTCGHHCLFFSFHRARGIPVKQIIQKYYSPTDLLKNDRMVFSFVQKINPIFASFV